MPRKAPPTKRKPPRESPRKASSPGRQYAALPFAEREGQTMVLLVTSRETRRWVLPKGWAEKRLAPHELAAKEAFEEAGILGQVMPEAIGSYAYLKRVEHGRTVTCKVEVFPLKVERLLEDWPEKSERERRWFAMAEAAMAVEEGDLVTLLLRLAAPLA
jgi:8-oxo-dGTP pyrophosphatase MutT (NUDIX family)